ncbi:Cytoskeletal protein [Echinococcus granulosus]|uniref:Cytoskeletal protein n=1 Tax=Echinococcus granulosus TaxID=6210 RepID=W6UAP3_ECHGR|nr:Cytoskeletal protein [Echinococcus granulosus]EUB55537.1 Cytoskeletal protein [Echinococcus granulosus]
MGEDDDEYAKDVQLIAEQVFCDSPSSKLAEGIAVQSRYKVRPSIMVKKFLASWSDTEANPLFLLPNEDFNDIYNALFEAAGIPMKNLDDLSTQLTHVTDVTGEICKLLINDISPHDALTAFLRVATRMDTYGIEPFDAKDQRGNGIAVGFNFKGLSVFKSSQQVNFFRWESMLSYECEKKTVVITIKTRDVKKKIGFKCDSRANAMQLYRRLREASRFYRSTDSEASDFSVNSSQTCQIKRISSFSRPQRFFTLSPPRASRKMIQLQVSSTEAVTPTNKPNFPLNCSPDVPTILLHPPDPDEGPNTPTFDPDVSITKPVGGAVTSLPKAVQPVISKCTAEEETVNLHEEEPEFLNENNDEKEEGRKRDPTKVGQEGGGDRDIDKGEEMEEGNDKKNEDRIGDQCKENAINVKGKAEEEEEEGNELLPAEVSYTPNSNSQESLLNVASPFGDAAKMSFFTNLESKRLGLGILDLKLSNSMTSITIPPTGSVSSASQYPINIIKAARSLAACVSAAFSYKDAFCGGFFLV